MENNNNEVKEKNRKKRFIGALKENFQKLIIIGISIVYITQGMFKMQKKDASIWEILGSIGISLIVGLIISGNLATMGLRDGRRGDLFINSVKAYGAAKEKATPMFDKLSPWCEYKNSWELEIKKKEIIQSCGLNWKAYKLGYYDEHKEKLNEKQTLAVENAKNCQIPKINSQELLSDLPKNKSKNGSRFGETEKEFISRNMVFEAGSRLFIGVVCGLYTLAPLFSKENIMVIIAGVLWNTSQVSMWIAFGLMKYADSKSFIEDEYRHTHIIQKTELLTEFVVTMTNNPKLVEEYDEDFEIDKYIEEYLSMRGGEKKDG